MSKDWIDIARRQLLDLRRDPAAWGYRPDTSPAVEPSALAGLALLSTDRDRHSGDNSRYVARDAGRWLASIRRPDGSLGVSLDLPEPGWPTPLALLLWAAIGGFEAERKAAVGWLLALKGRTTIQAKDDPMGHDASIVGWPWVADTHSWVEPSAMALLALAREGQSGHPRTREGARLLIDRAIPRGGWNLGNPVVFGRELRPLPGPSGLALLALASLGNRSNRVISAVRYLRAALAETLAPISLGWGLLGLRAWGEEPSEGEGWLSSAFEKLARRAPGEPKAVELALLLLATGSGSLELLGIRPQTEASRHA